LASSGTSLWYCSAGTACGAGGAQGVALRLQPEQLQRSPLQHL
jgi:hypothetical protein